jgi:hypothetical protein
MAHEIPPTVVVRGFVRPEGASLRFLVRVPLESMRDVTFPTRGANYLDTTGLEPLLRQAAMQWIGDYVRFDEDGVPLGPPSISSIRISLPTDPSFRGYQSAVAHFDAARFDPATNLPWRQAMLDVAFSYPIRADRARFAITPSLAHLGVRTTTVLQFLSPERPERIFQLEGNPGRVRLDPRWYQAAARFVRFGIGHILDGLDHLLFLVALVLPVRRFWALVPVVTSFTVAHSITLIASALGFAPSALWFPPLIETLIAASIVFMVIENVVGSRTDRRWLMAFGFGLVHGFGFAFALGETLQFAGGHLLTALLAFNLGVEIGQLLVVAVAVPLLGAVFRHLVVERIGTIVISVLVGHTAWHWMTDRGAALLEHRLAAPSLDAAAIATLLRWLMLGTIVAATGWLLGGLFHRLARRSLPAGR